MRESGTLKGAPSKLLLLGNPNAGKSTLFNALTGGHARVGNWHGVTVSALEGEALLSGNRVRVADLPGVYCADGLGMEERAACAYLNEHPEGVVCLVSECAALPRSLALLSALAKGRRAILVLTKKRQFMRQGGKLEERELERCLGIPVVSAEGVSPRELRERVGEALLRAGPLGAASEEGRSLPKEVYTRARMRLTKLDRFLLHPAAACAVFALLLAAAFFLTFSPVGPGGLLKGLIEALIIQIKEAFQTHIPSPVLLSLIHISEPTRH